MAFKKVVISKHSKCTYKNGFLQVRQGVESQQIYVGDIDCVIFETRSALISAHLLTELARQHVAVMFCDEKHLPIADVVPRYGACDMNRRLQEQLSWTKPAKKQLWKRVIQDKITHQADVLDYFEIETAKELYAMAKEVTSGDTTGREAAAAHAYFPLLFGVGFTREINCPINDALNYGYSLLLGYCAREIAGKGYITQMGINHKSIFNQYNFACDLMEPFRPIVDCFVADNRIIEFDKSYRAKLISLLDLALPYKDGKYKVTSIMSDYISESICVLNRDMKPDEINEFKLFE